MKKRINAALSKLTDNVNSREIYLKASQYLVVHVGGVLLTFVLAFVISNKHGAEAWGAFALIFNYISLLSLVLGFGLDIYGIKILNNEHKESKSNNYWGSIVTFVVIISILISGVHFLLREQLQKLLDYDSITSDWFFYLVLCLPVFTLNNLLISYIRGLKNTTLSGFLRNTIIWLFMGLFFSFFRLVNPFDPVEDLSKSYLLAGLVSVIIGSYYLIKNNYLFISRKISDSFAYTIRNLKYSYPFLLIFLLQASNVSLDRFIVQNLLDLKSVGVYDVVLKVNSVPNLVYTSVNAILLPKFAELFSKSDKFGMQKIAKDSSKLIFWLSIPIIAILSLGSGLVLGFFGTDFSEGILPLLILLFGQVIINSAGSAEAVLQMSNNQKLFQWIFAGSLIINLGGCILLIPYFGLVGAAVAKLLSVLFWRFIASYFAKKKLDISTVFFMK